LKNYIFKIASVPTLTTTTTTSVESKLNFL